jgi:hypothetical protein
MYQYTVMVFEKDGDDTLVAQYKINRLTLSELQRLFGIDGSNPMFDCYLVSETQRESIEKDIGIRLDIARFDYFVSCESAD